jgi:predicted permease
MSQTRERHRASNALAVCQVALAAVLLIGAGLMIHTFQALRTVEPGFTQAAQLETFRVSIPRSLVQDVNRFAQMQTDIGWKLANIPGVSSVGFESEIPMAGEATDWDAVIVEGKSYAAAEIPPVRIFKYVSPGVFRTEGARMIAGRDFTAADQAGRRHLVIISENLAREQWGSAAAAVGQRIRTALPAAAWHQVIGVVQDIHENGLQQVPPAIVYWPVVADGQYGPSGLRLTRNATFLLRTPSAGTEALMEQVRRTVWSVDASLPVASVQTMQEVYDRSLAQTSFTLVMLAISSTMALLLGLIGIYGVISYAVSQRTREMGIRSALGAGPGALRQMFVRQALGLAGTGVLIGLGAAAALSRLMKSILYGTSPMDPITFVAVPVVLILAAVVASYVPARRASAVDPLESLRSD